MPNKSEKERLQREAQERADAGGDVDGDQVEVEQTYTFNPDDIVKQLPPGMCLCPMCLGMMAIVEDPPFDPRTHICDVCHGHGKLRTGSLIGADAEHPCWGCNGTGWQAALGHEPDAVPARREQFVDDAPPARDVDGRTPDDPDFDWTRVVVPSPVPAPVDVLPGSTREPATVD